MYLKTQMCSSDYRLTYVLWVQAWSFPACLALCFFASPRGARPLSPPLASDRQEPEFPKVVLHGPLSHHDPAQDQDVNIKVHAF